MKYGAQTQDDALKLLDYYKNLPPIERLFDVEALGASIEQGGLTAGDLHHLANEVRQSKYNKVGPNSDMLGITAQILPMMPKMESTLVP